MKYISILLSVTCICLSACTQKTETEDTNTGINIPMENQRKSYEMPIEYPDQPGSGGLATILNS